MVFLKQQQWDRQQTQGVKDGKVKKTIRFSPLRCFPNAVTWSLSRNYDQHHMEGLIWHVFIDSVEFSPGPLQNQSLTSLSKAGEESLVAATQADSLNEYLACFFMPESESSERCYAYPQSCIVNEMSAQVMTISGRWLSKLRLEKRTKFHKVNTLRLWAFLDLPLHLVDPSIKTYSRKVQMRVSVKTTQRSGKNESGRGEK